MKKHNALVLLFGCALLAGCATAQASKESSQTANAARGASTAAGNEANQVGAMSGAIDADVQDIKSVRTFYKTQRTISFD